MEIDPGLKRALHARLVGEGRHLKDWFLDRVNDYLNPRQQEIRFAAASPDVPKPPVYKVKETPVLQAADSVKPKRRRRRR